MMKRYYYELMDEGYGDLGAFIPDGWHKSVAIRQAMEWMRENGVTFAKLAVNTLRTNMIVDIIEIDLQAPKIN